MILFDILVGRNIGEIQSKMKKGWFNCITVAYGPLFQKTFIAN